MKKMIKSLFCAIKGFCRAVSEERHMRLHLVALYAVTVFSVMYGLTGVEWALVAFACGLVIATELFNTAAERITDLAVRDVHPLAAYAKDAAAAAVLVAALTAVVVAVCVFSSAEKWNAVFSLLLHGYGWLWFVLPAAPAVWFIFRAKKERDRL